MCLLVEHAHRRPEISVSQYKVKCRFPKGWISGNSSSLGWYILKHLIMHTANWKTNQKPRHHCPFSPVQVKRSSVRMSLFIQNCRPSRQKHLVWLLIQHQLSNHFLPCFQRVKQIWRNDPHWKTPRGRFYSGVCDQHHK